MKQTNLLIALFLTGIISSANPVTNDTVKNWKSRIETSLGVSQTTFTNWSKGGENTLSAKAMLNIFEDYSKGKFSWNNYLGAAYMVQKQESFSDWRKADDKLNVFTKAGLYA